MSETNREKAFRWMEDIWNHRRAGVIDELLAEDAVGHHEGAETSGPESFKAYVISLIEVFPDIQITVDHAIEEGDHVAIRWSALATHEGPGLGIPVTGAEVEFNGMTWLTFNGTGNIVEMWDSWNRGALTHQLAQAALVL
jgi:steroid delta-isomerase-like uncharacterized protein